MEPRASGGGEDGEGEGDGGGGEISHMCESKGHRPLRAAAQKRKKKTTMKQGRIHGNPVADGWARAVMQKPLGIQKCDGRTDRPTNRPTN